MALDNAKVFLFDVNFNEELRTKLRDMIPPHSDQTQRVKDAAKAAIELGYDFTTDELKCAMEEYGTLDALELNAITSHSGVCNSVVQNRDECAASVETGIWCTAQTSPATVGTTFMSM